MASYCSFFACQSYLFCIVVLVLGRLLKPINLLQLSKEEGMTARLLKPIKLNISRNKLNPTNLFLQLSKEEVMKGGQQKEMRYMYSALT
jgi:hypothetical protein